MTRKTLANWQIVSVDNGVPSIAVHMHKQSGALVFELTIGHHSVELTPDDALDFCRHLQEDLERWAPDAVRAAYS